MTVKEFLVLTGVSSRIEDVRESIEALPKPRFIERMKVPDDLNDITFGQFIRLQAMSDPRDLIFTPCRELLGMSDRTILKSRACDVLGLSVWTVKEVARIGRLFASTGVKPTKEEVAAGVEQLQFGVFGLIDHYATRMGMTDHEEVEYVPWVRVYKCLDIDAKRAAYQRRLQRILSEQ